MALRAYGHELIESEMAHYRAVIREQADRISQLDDALYEIKTQGLCRCVVPGCSNRLMQRAADGYSTCSPQCAGWFARHRDEVGALLVPVQINDMMRRRGIMPPKEDGSDE